MRPFLLVLAKDLLRKLRSPLASIAFLLFPIIFSLLIGVTFGGRGGKMAPIQVALVDEDGGLVARLLRSSFTQDRMPQQFDLRLVEAAEAERLVEKNKVSAIVRIPPGFSDSLLDARPTRLEVVKNPAQSIYPQIVEQVVKVLGRLGGSAVRILEEPLREIRGSVDSGSLPSDAFVSRTSLLISHRMTAVGRYAFPPAVRIEKPASGEAGEAGEGDGVAPFRVALYILPGMAIFSLLMLALSSMADFQREAQAGTLARQFASPVGGGSVVLGKLAATWVLSLASIAILSVLVMIWSDGPIGFAAFILLSIAFALAATGFAAVLYSLFRSERAAGAFGSILVIVMSMVGGSFVPLEMLPDFIRSIAPATLIYWGAEGYRNLLLEGAGLRVVGPNILVLAAVGMILSAIAVLRFQRRYVRGRGD